jgi:AhpD family alkylhydroperoxidase
MGELLARATRRTTLRHVQHVRPVHPRAANGLVAEVYGQIERDFGMLAPPMSLHSPAPGPLAAAWSILRETLLVDGVTNRQSREVVAAAVSLGNSCPYCVDVHGTTLAGLVGDNADAEAVTADRIDAVTDPQLRELARWARASGGSQAAPTPFPAAHAPELIGVAVTFQYLNRMVNIFLPASPIPPTVRGAARRATQRMAARMLGSMARRGGRPGDSAHLLPAAPLPPDLSWAAGNPHIAEAFARAARAFDAGGAHAVPETVQQLVRSQLADPTQSGPGISAHAWLDEAVADLPEADRPAGRLAMLTLFAAYRVTPDVLDGLRRRQPGDDTLIELTSWVSMTAARHIGTRLGAAVETAAPPSTTHTPPRGTPSRDLT